MYIQSLRRCVMQTQVKEWGHSQGIRISREVLKSAGIVLNEVLDITVSNGVITLSKTFQHKTLEERAKELFLEGFRLADLKRWEKGFKRQPQTGTITGENYSSLKINGNDKRYIWLIPQHEVTASGGIIIQNER